MSLHDFPGNVRELSNVVEHAFVICPGDTILPEHLPASLRSELPSRSGESPPRTLKDMERWTILEVLRRCDWNRQAAADSLGVHKTTLMRKIEALGIDLPKQDGRSSRRG